MDYSTVSYGLQLFGFILATGLSTAVLLTITISEFANRSVHFAILEWFSNKSTFWGLGDRGWYLTLRFLQVFGVLGLVLMLIFGIPFPYSFYLSFIAGCLWVYGKCAHE